MFLGWGKSLGQSREAGDLLVVWWAGSVFPQVVVTCPVS